MSKANTQLTIHQKIEVLKLALENLKNDNEQFICWAIYNAAELLGFLNWEPFYAEGITGVLKYFPEVLKLKPKVVSDITGVWFFHGKGYNPREERIKLLTKALKQLLLKRLKE